MAILLDLEKWLDGVQKEQKLMWTSTDATLDVVDGVNWRIGHFLRLLPLGIVRYFTSRERETDYIGMRACYDRWNVGGLGCDRPEFPFDSAWGRQYECALLDGEGGKGRTAQKLLAHMHMRRILYDMEAQRYMIRFLHNISADFPTSGDKDAIASWSLLNKMSVVDLQGNPVLCKRFSG